MEPKIPKNVIFTASGTRGIVGEGLVPEFLIPLGMAYGTWLRNVKGGLPPRIIMGRDTRPSGLMIESGMIHAFLATGCEVYNAGLCATPALVHARMHSPVGFDGAAIISASHNPAEYNGLKFLSPNSPGTFLSNEELAELKEIFFDTSKYHVSSWKEPGKYVDYDATTPYLDSIKNYVKTFLPGTVSISVVVDSGGGAGIVSTVPLLEDLGCKVTSINDELDDVPPFFPRNSEPIAENLGVLSRRVVEEGADFGLALDCDADRLSLCDEKGNVLREDVGLAFLMQNLLEMTGEKRKLVIVTNVASSLMFEEIAKHWNGKVIRVPVGERYLAVQMNDLVMQDEGKGELAIIGGEGSCGGVMLPELNLARDASIAAALVVAILEKRKKPLSELVTELVPYHLKKVKLNLKGKDAKTIMSALVEQQEPGTFKRVLNDIRMVGDDWWVLIHPSNTEPIIRVMVEAKDEHLAEALLKKHKKEVLDLL
ncbi:MAG: phosphoglucosamine mutase [Promethearchaeota archaeon]